MQLRKTVLIREIVDTDETGAPCDRLCRVAAVAVIRNPLAGDGRDDLGALFEIGAALGERLAAEAVAALGAPAVCYGKAAIVGAAGLAEHGAALLHPRFGAPVRTAIGGGADIIPGTKKAAGPGASSTMPIGNKDDRWVFDDMDAAEIAIPDAPREDEILIALVLSTGGRPHARVKKP